MGAMNPSHVPFSVVVKLGTTSADANPIPGSYLYAHRKCVITNVALVDGVGIAESDTDFAVIKLMNGADEIASYDTREDGQGALAANVAKEADVLSGEIAAGSTLTVSIAETHTIPEEDPEVPVVLTAAAMVVTGYWVETA